MVEFYFCQVILAQAGLYIYIYHMYHWLRYYDSLLPLCLGPFDLYHA